MIIFSKCNHAFEDTKEPEISMGVVECPKCKSKLDQSGKVVKSSINLFFSNLLRNK